MRRELTEKERKRIEKSDQEIKDLYDFYLDKARREVSEEDLPEDADYEFYRYLSFERQHLMGQYYSKTWSHAAELEANRTIRFGRYYRIMALCAMAFFAVLLVLSLLKFLSLDVAALSLCWFIDVNFYLVVDLIADNQVDRRNDVLRMAARYQVMQELLEKKFLEDKVE